MKKNSTKENFKEINLIKKLLKITKFDLNKEEFQQFLNTDLPYFKKQIAKINNIKTKNIKTCEYIPFLKRCCHWLKKEEIRENEDKIKTKFFKVNDKIIDQDNYLIIKNVKK